MKYFAIFLTALIAAAGMVSAEAGKVLIFAVLIDDTPVELEDGAKWLMDKGDAFPVLMFKEQRTKAVLQLVGTSFLIDTKHIRVVEEKDVNEEILTSYRRNVSNYLDGRVKKWRAVASGEKPAE